MIPVPFLLDEGKRDDWTVLTAVRGAATKAIEPMRRDGVIGHSLDTRVTLFVADELRQRIEGLNTDLRAFCIVSQIALQPLENAPQDAYRDEEIAGLPLGLKKPTAKNANAAGFTAQSLARMRAIHAVPALRRCHQGHGSVTLMPRRYSIPGIVRHCCHGSRPGQQVGRDAIYTRAQAHHGYCGAV